MNLCIFCGQSLDNGQDVVTLGIKGCQGIAEASRAQGSSINALPGQRVHSKCRHRHCSKKRIDIMKRTRDNIASETTALLCKNI